MSFLKEDFELQLNRPFLWDSVSTLILPVVHNKFSEDYFLLNFLKIWLGNLTIGVVLMNKIRSE